MGKINKVNFFYKTIKALTNKKGQTIDGIRALVLNPFLNSNQLRAAKKDSKTFGPSYFDRALVDSSLNFRYL